MKSKTIFVYLYRGAPIHSTTLPDTFYPSRKCHEAQSLREIVIMLQLPLPCVEPLPWEFVYASHCLTCPSWQCIPSPTHLICIALEGAEGIGGAMAFEVVPTAAGRLHSDQYTKIIIINTPINLRVFPCSNQPAL